MPWGSTLCTRLTSELVQNLFQPRRVRQRYSGQEAGTYLAFVLGQVGVLVVGLHGQVAVMVGGIKPVHLFSLSVEYDVCVVESARHANDNLVFALSQARDLVLVWYRLFY